MNKEKQEIEYLQHRNAQLLKIATVGLSALRERDEDSFYYLIKSLNANLDHYYQLIRKNDTPSRIIAESEILNILEKEMQEYKKNTPMVVNPEHIVICATPDGYEKRQHTWKNRFLCWIGYHNWVWNISDTDGVVYINGAIPAVAKCSRCGITYK